MNEQNKPFLNRFGESLYFGFWFASGVLIWGWKPWLATLNTCFLDAWNFTCIVTMDSPNNLITVVSPYLWKTFQDPQKVPETGVVLNLIYTMFFLYSTNIPFHLKEALYGSLCHILIASISIRSLWGHYLVKYCLFEHKHYDTSTVDLITKWPMEHVQGERTEQSFTCQAEWSRLVQDFITILRMACNLALRNYLFVELSI